jgi:hypothetical protein
VAELDGVAVKHHHGSSTMWGGALVHVDARRKHGAGFHTGILDFSDSVLYRDVTCRTVTTRAGSATDWPSVQTTSHTDVMGFSVSAQTRASLSLTGSTRLDPATVLATVKTAAAGVKGGGASLLTTGLQNLGAQVNVENERDSHLALSVTSGKRLVELCTFSAVAQGGKGGGTAVTIGGLETYKTTQSTVLGFIPVGPKMIAGYAPYKNFLNVVADAIRSADGDATIQIAEHVGA